jgi:hypothetical protein
MLCSLSLFVSVEESVLHKGAWEIIWLVLLTRKLMSLFGLRLRAGFLLFDLMLGVVVVLVGAGVEVALIVLALAGSAFDIVGVTSPIVDCSSVV